MLNEDLSLLKEQHEPKSDFSSDAVKLSQLSETDASGSSLGEKHYWVDELRIDDDDTNDDDEKVTRRRRRCISNNVVI